MDEDNKKLRCYFKCAGEEDCTAFVVKDDESIDMTTEDGINGQNCFLYKNGPYANGGGRTGFTCYIMGKKFRFIVYC